MPIKILPCLLLLSFFSVIIIIIIKPATSSTHDYHDYLRVKAGTPSTVVSRVTPMATAPAFLANISIGEPRVSQLLILDTGSDLTWTQCIPCNCYPQTIPFFNPSRSSSYRNISCKSNPQAMPQLNYDQKYGICRYYLRYQDHTSTGGVLAKEKLTFQTANDGLVSVPDVVFGCGHDNSGTYNLYSGVLGLGPGMFSVVKKFDSKFSYCFGSLTDMAYLHNVLILGENAVMEGDPTPLEIFEDRYYLNLQAISVGETRLDVDPDVFVRTQFGSGTVIDTGCSATLLVREAYENLVREIDFLLKGVLERTEDWDAYSNPCYRGNVRRDLIGFPVVTLHFEGRAELALDVESLFLENGGGDEFCLAVSMNPMDGRSVIGVMSQQNYNVGFDLNAMKVYFQRIDCELLD